MTPGVRLGSTVWDLDPSTDRVLAFPEGQSADQRAELREELRAGTLLVNVCV